MPYLDNSNRRLLENAVLSARDAAEAGAKTALNALAVSAPAPHQVMTPEQRKLRVVLRAQMRRLGGFEDLVQACAYEQWHRMLFARFLAENSLLLHPEYGTITLDECVELAREQGIADPWDLAAQYASEMLPGIFRPDDPLLQVKLAPEGREALERILEGIPSAVFTSDDGLGWVYQYWQANRKDEVNRAERKIEGADICAVTQLFTEPYMVRFLLQNTLGAWWLSLHPDSPLRARMEFHKPEVQHDFSAWPDEVDGLRVGESLCPVGFHPPQGLPDGAGRCVRNVAREVQSGELHQLVARDSGYVGAHHRVCERDDAVYHAVMLDPLTSAVCTLPQLHDMTSEMLAAQARWLPQFEF